MTNSARKTAQPRNTLGLAGLLVIQSIAAVFFVGDVVSDILHDGFEGHSAFEAVVVVALLIGLWLSGRDLRRAMELIRSQDVALKTARGALADVIAVQFTAWGLTPAERDVGFFALKGLDVAEISALRNAAAGTVRAQLTRIYAKAGVSGRAQFAAFFVEDLLAEGLSPLHVAA